MSHRSSPWRRRRYLAAPAAAAAVLCPLVAASGGPATGQAGRSTYVGSTPLVPGALLVSTVQYLDDSGIVAGSTQLPPGCATSSVADDCVTAVAGGAYPQVFNNDTVDGSFGITAPIVLQELAPDGKAVGTIDVPSGPGGVVSSFSSKSELALNLSTDGHSVTFMGYAAPSGALDVSNSNTPAVVDPTNPVPSSYYRVVAQLGSDGQFHFTLTNAYSGNNGRAAILDNADNVIFTAGNAGNGGNPQPDGVVLGAGAQILRPSTQPESAQKPGLPTPGASFSVTELGDKADKIGKDDNFRGLTQYGNVLYYTKGSGGNGVDTVYFVDTTGSACPSGSGLPAPGAALPNWPLAYDPSVLSTEGLQPTNMCVLKGFPTNLAKSTSSYPFGIWFANPDTLYVADEGNGTASYAGGTYTAAAAQTTAGLQKWVFDPAAAKWNLAYTITSGLNLGQPYRVSGYPTGTNPATGLPWAPATDGLRNVTGRVNPDGTVTIYGITSTVSGSGDQGADPNRLVVTTDRLSQTRTPQYSFKTLETAQAGQVLRGVSFTPGS